MSDKKKKSSGDGLSDKKNDNAAVEKAKTEESVPSDIQNEKTEGSLKKSVKSEAVNETGKKNFTVMIRDAAEKCTSVFFGFAEKHNIFSRFIGIYLLISAVKIIINRNTENAPHWFNDWKTYCEKTNLQLILFIAAAAFILITFLKEKIAKFREVNTDSYILAGGSVLFGCAAVWRSDNFWLALSVIMVIAIFITCYIKKGDFRHLSKLNSKIFFIAVIALAAGVASFISYCSIMQYRCFYDSTFDLGIFVQMYHSIVTKFTFDTTCERNELLSHFAVHTSPVYLLLAPFYFFFRKTETLLIAQGILAVSGVIPLWLICKKYKFSNTGAFLMSIVFIFSSSLISPCFYDFHENVFLPSLLMWFFYAIEKDKHVLMYIMMVLVLSVKEDAALYVMCIGLYLLVSGRKRRHGFIIFTLSAAYFLTVTSLMGKYGEGVMTSRTYGNLMTDWNGGFGNVIATVLTNPAYFISECIKEDKMKFILIMLIPLMFVPFATKKASRLIIVVPFVLMNLATGYPYAFNQGYQYVFGTTACLMYVSVMNLSDFSRDNFRSVISVMAAASVITSVSLDSGKLYFGEIHRDFNDRYVMMESCLDTIPDEASVLAYTWSVPYLANRDEIYMLEENMKTEDDYNNGNAELNYDFIVFSEGDHSEEMNEMRKVAEMNGYTEYCGNPGGVQVYISSEYLEKIKG